MKFVKKLENKSGTMFGAVNKRYHLPIQMNYSQIQIQILNGLALMILKVSK
jgi:hypothetical protein